MFWKYSCKLECATFLWSTYNVVMIAIESGLYFLYEIYYYEQHYGKVKHNIDYDYSMILRSILMIGWQNYVSP